MYSPCLIGYSPDSPRTTRLAVMATNSSNNMDERQERIDAMVEQIREQKRRLVERGIALWNRTEAMHEALRAMPAVPPNKLN